MSPLADPEARKRYEHERYRTKCNNPEYRTEREAYRQANLDRIAAQRATAYQENLAANRAARRAYAATHREEAKARAKANRLARKGTPEYKAMKQAWAEKNREKDRASKAAYKKRNPEREAEHSMRRYARLKAVTTEPIDRSRVWERDEGMCHICGLPADRRRWHLDHIIPIVDGGPHAYDNVGVSHPLCNQRKNRYTVVSARPIKIGAIL